LGFNCFGNWHKYGELLTLWCPAAFRDFRKKKRLNARGFAQEYLRSCTGYGPGRSVKRCGKSSSLQSKKKYIVDWLYKC